VSNSLAAEAGLYPGLIIQQIDGTNTVGKPLRECRLMTFGPIGSEIHFVVVDPAKNQTNMVTVLRQQAAMRDAH
jgi:C-terminal processing protease CtpA/Prc